MIFASDLDSTLIYSSRHCKLINEEKLLPVDFYNNKCSCITKSMHHTLQLINKSMLFIPVTTRSESEYKRIKYFYEEIKPKYAIVANGGILLKNGIELTAWSDIISSKIKEVVSAQDMIKLCSFFLESDLVKSYKTCGDFFIYSIIDEEKLSDMSSNQEMNLGFLNDLKSLCLKYNYSVSKQGRKVYIVPNCINKYDPLNYIMHLENINVLIAAGDSLLDYPMIRHSDYGIIPSHGELLCNFPLDRFGDTVYITKESGVFAGEEVLDRVHQKFHEINGISEGEVCSYI
jgi:hydroxymethylpyrimidine pyrophosphatase-like HAD family hydrolase